MYIGKKKTDRARCIIIIIFIIMTMIAIIIIIVNIVNEWKHVKK